MHVLVYALDPELDGLDGKSVPPALLYGSVFPAVWSFQLALRARGLGTAPLYVADQAAVNEVVGAPQSAHIACLLPVAFFTGSSFQPPDGVPSTRCCPGTGGTGWILPRETCRKREPDERSEHRERPRGG